MLLRIIAIIVLLLPQVYSEALDCRLVIKSLIQEVQKNGIKANLKNYCDFNQLKLNKKHPQTLESLNRIFAKVDISKIQFTKPVSSGNTIRVNMQGSLNYNFTLMHATDLYTTKLNSHPKHLDYYIITSIHP